MKIQRWWGDVIWHSTLIFIPWPPEFSWEEKLVAPLIAAPNGEMCK
jgi:hypothetical protein